MQLTTYKPLHGTGKGEAKRESDKERRIKRITQKERNGEAENETERGGRRKKGREGKTEGSEGEKTEGRLMKQRKRKGARCFGFVSPWPVHAWW